MTEDRPPLPGKAAGGGLRLLSDAVQAKDRRAGAGHLRRGGAALQQQPPGLRQLRQVVYLLEYVVKAFC